MHRKFDMIASVNEFKAVDPRKQSTAIQPPSVLNRRSTGACVITNHDVKVTVPRSEWSRSSTCHTRSNVAVFDASELLTAIVCFYNESLTQSTAGVGWGRWRGNCPMQWCQKAERKQHAITSAMSAIHVFKAYTASHSNELCEKTKTAMLEL